MSEWLMWTIGVFTFLGISATLYVVIGYLFDEGDDDHT